jgi:hypothetical protein
MTVARGTSWTRLAFTETGENTMEGNRTIPIICRNVKKQGYLLLTDGGTACLPSAVVDDGDRDAWVQRVLRALNTQANIKVSRGVKPLFVNTDGFTFAHVVTNDAYTYMISVQSHARWVTLDRLAESLTGQRDMRIIEYERERQRFSFKATGASRAAAAARIANMNH